MNNNSNLEFRKIKSLNYLYEVNENGTIFRNVKSKKQLKIKLDMHHSDSGYYATFVHLNGRTADSTIKRVMIHKVVAECWLGDIPDGYEVDHIDRNSHNNDYRNLRYVTKSEQMKNRDHSGIAERGRENLENARKQRMKPVKLIDISTGEIMTFESYADCARKIDELKHVGFDRMRDKLKRHRSNAYGYDIIYLNAETGHGGSTEQGTVHSRDLTGDYSTAFNKGKKQETEQRVKHVGVME